MGAAPYSPTSSLPGTFFINHRGEGKVEGIGASALVYGGMLEETFLSKNNFLFSFIPELSEDWSSVREPVIDGVPFYAKYLGSSLVQKPSGEEATSEAIKTIIAMASFF